MLSALPFKKGFLEEKTGLCYTDFIQSIHKGERL